MGGGKRFGNGMYQIGYSVKKTRHNEVAPNQFELAPIFEETKCWRLDHNLLLMDVHGIRLLIALFLKYFFTKNLLRILNVLGNITNWSFGKTDTGV